jgi:DNA-binding transcriptional ArsR family regulator
MSAPTAAQALFGRTRHRVLSLLFTHADRSYYLREIVRAVRTGSGSVQREVGRLAAAGLLLMERRGAQVHYRANPVHPAYAELRGLVTKAGERRSRERRRR